MKRFTDTDKFLKPWIRPLEPEYKLFWVYLTDRCSNQGVWDVDFELANFILQTSIERGEAKKVFGHRVYEFDGGNKWFIPAVIDFQYGDLSPDCKPHKPIINFLEKNPVLKRVWEGYRKGMETLKEKEKEKDTHTEKEKDKGGIVKGGDRPESADRRAPSDPGSDRPESARRRPVENSADRPESARRRPRKSDKPETEMHQHMDFVMLTVDEYKRLLDVMGPALTRKYIDRLNGYIGQIGPQKAAAKYKSHYYTIRNWWNRDRDEGKTSAEPESEAMREYQRAVAKERQQ